VTLRELIEEMDVVAVTGNLDVTLAGLAYDSRRVRAGDAFFALAGLKQDGARFVRDAIHAGAAAVVSAAGVAVAGVPHVAVAEPRLALAQAASRIEGHPSRGLAVVAVTGTNGKTTTTWMLESIFRAAGWSAGVIGTTGVRFSGTTRASSFTTPESPELQALLAEMRAAGVRAVAMEVSSHALAQRRSYSLEADVCVFTNLTQDHLDFHGTMEAYLDAKLMLFDGRNGLTAKPTVAVVNAEDPSAAAVERAARADGRRVVRVSGVPFGRGHGGEVSLEDLELLPDGLMLGFRAAERLPEPSALPSPAFSRHGKTRVRLPLLGRFNAENAALAYGAALALGLPHEAIRRGLEAVPQVPGRLERVEAGQPFMVAVDYAHTPDALERALAAVREHARGRLLVVFGCGGDRDRGKRPRMGEVAARGADAIWITNDNPRSEDPRAIANEIVAGIAQPPAGGLAVELDRRAAIAAALAAARAGDAVLIAGKGHETTQTTGDRIEPFDDRQVARELLAGGSGS